jgi:hypothetical protein
MLKGNPKMKRILTYFGVVVAIGLLMPNALAQKATELYIPIGKSPGISGKCSMVGTIDSAYVGNHILYMHNSTSDAYNSYTVKITDETKIYLDKSGLKKSNQVGSFADCKQGAYCEVLYESHTRKESGEAEWIKIRVTADMEK